MKAIIIAAGRGKRMLQLCSELPKCLLKVNGATILRHQINVFKACGINEIIVIKGYKGELIDYPDVRYRVNERYRENNILNSLFCAADDLDDEAIISYSDILFESRIVSDLISLKADIAAVGDILWEERYVNRHAHPKQEAEKIVMEAGSRALLGIGKILKNPDQANAEFIGMVKVSKVGSSVLKEVFSQVKEAFDGKPFQTAKTFQQAYLTDMLQELVDRGIRVDCLAIKGGWIEIDTPEDYEQAMRHFAKHGG